MAFRNVYTGCANENTLTIIEPGDCLYIAYASGQDIVIHTETGRFVQSISHSEINESIARLAAGPDGCIAAVSGKCIYIFKPENQGSCTSSDKATSDSRLRWQCASRLDILDLENSSSISDCQWIDSTTLVISTGNAVSLWSLSENAWERQWEQNTAGQIDKVVSFSNANIFATMSFGSRFVKVWQFSKTSRYVRFRYIVHPESVIDMFWQQQQQKQQRNFETEPCSGLYTVTSDFRLCLWRSAPDCGNDRCINDSFYPLNIRFALAASIDILQDGVGSGSDLDMHRRPVSIGLWHQKYDFQNLPDAGIAGIAGTAAATSSISSTSSSSSSSSRVPETKQSDTQPCQNHDSMAIDDNTSNSCSGNDKATAMSDGLNDHREDTTIRATAGAFNNNNTDTNSSKSGSRPLSASKRLDQLPSYPYAVFNDGSIMLWEAKQGPSDFSVASVRSSGFKGANMAVAAFHTINDCSNRLLLRSRIWDTDNVSSGSSESDFVLQLALSDSVGHVFLYDVPALSRDNMFTHSLQPYLLELNGLWDGHKEPIFHISVDPYGQRVATHSVEGELLVWDQIDIAGGKRQSISRRMALDGSNIRTIAWAPADSEFIAATSKHVYLLLFNKETSEWAPCATSLPELRVYDRIFTYPADEVDRLDSSQDTRTQSYYISTVDKQTMTVQTWHATGQHGKIVFVDNSKLSSPARFDHVSRVMPVTHPFFSRDNIMATFDSSSGKLRIWGIRTDPRFVWFCSKEHKLPCMNVDMIRYNSIDKAAIVSTEPDGSQMVTIWVFSSASRASHYLPAGTIRPRSKSDRVREIRWHLTEFAQTYLGIQWDRHIDIYCQERNLDDAWTCVFSIAAGDYGADKKIGSFSFTAAGEPTFSIDRKLVTYALQISDGSTLAEAAYNEHGQLPFIHPYVLTELMSWGRIGIARKVLAQLYDYLREKEIDSTRKISLPMVSLQELVTFENSEQSGNQPLFSGAEAGAGSASQRTTGTRYLALFSDMDGMGSDDKDSSMAVSDLGRFTQEKADFLIEKLAEIKIDGISHIDQARLMSIIGTISASLTDNQPIDSMGIRYLVKLQLLELENKRTRSSAELPYRELNWAMHSNSQAILLHLCLQRQQDDGSGRAAAGLTWESARRMGICLWLSDSGALLSEVEKMARNIFVSEGRDPSKCAIFYLALRKQRLLHGLWRTAHSHPEHSKMAAFLAHDFSEARWRTAAAKNAYVLLSRQRYLDAAAFFMLSGKLIDAATICITQLKDLQLAITICRCYEGDNGPVLKEILWKHILPDAFKRQDRWLASLCFGLIGKYDLVLQSLTDDLTRLAQQIGVEADESKFSTMDILDTELLILYRNMINHSPFYRAPLVTQAELIAQTITIFECLGAPVMSLVVLEWWRRELFEITKKSSALAKTHHKLGSGASITSLSTASLSISGADPLSSETLDSSSSMGLFAGYSGLTKPTPDPAAADPLASGVLSMGSFGSMFSGKLNKTTTATANSLSTAAFAPTNGHTTSSHINGSKTSESSSLKEDNIDESTLAVEIEDTPVQYACRVALALQIIEFVSKSASDSSLDLDREKQAVAGMLRLPLSIFFRRS